MVARLWLLVGVIGIAAPAAAQTAAAPAPEEPVVVMSGEGLVKAAPDQAWARFAVETRSKDPKEAQAQNARSMNGVHERLIAAGLPKGALRTLSYDLHLEADWVNGKQVPRGYIARNTIEVRIDDILRVGEIIDLAIGAGANAVQGVRFDLKERDALEREALKQATADARGRAEAAASGVGAAIGRVVRIEEPTVRTFPLSPVAMRAEAQDARVSTPVAAGEIEIRASVVLTATLKH